MALLGRIERAAVSVGNRNFDCGILAVRILNDLLVGRESVVALKTAIVEPCLGSQLHTVYRGQSHSTSLARLIVRKGGTVDLYQTEGTVRGGIRLIDRAAVGTGGVAHKFGVINGHRSGGRDGTAISPLGTVAFKNSITKNQHRASVIGKECSALGVCQVVTEDQLVASLVRKGSKINVTGLTAVGADGSALVISDVTLKQTRICLDKLHRKDSAAARCLVVSEGTTVHTEGTRVIDGAAICRQIGGLACGIICPHIGHIDGIILNDTAVHGHLSADHCHRPTDRSARAQINIPIMHTLISDLFVVGKANTGIEIDLTALNDKEGASHHVHRGVGGVSVHRNENVVIRAVRTAKGQRGSHSLHKAIAAVLVGSDHEQVPRITGRAGQGHCLCRVDPSCIHHIDGTVNHDIACQIDGVRPGGGTLGKLLDAVGLGKLKDSLYRHACRHGTACGKFRTRLVDPFDKMVSCLGCLGQGIDAVRGKPQRNLLCSDLHRNDIDRRQNGKLTFLGYATDLAVSCLTSYGVTGRLVCYRPLPKGMRNHRNRLGARCCADRTSIGHLALDRTGSLAGQRPRIPGMLGKGRNGFLFCLAALRAGIGHDPGILAGGSQADYSFSVCMGMFRRRILTIALCTDKNCHQHDQQNSKLSYDRSHAHSSFRMCSIRNSESIGLQFYKKPFSLYHICRKMSSPTKSFPNPKKMDIKNGCSVPFGKSNRFSFFQGLHAPSS